MLSRCYKQRLFLFAAQPVFAINNITVSTGNNCDIARRWACRGFSCLLYTDTQPHSFGNFYHILIMLVVAMDVTCLHPNRRINAVQRVLRSALVTHSKASAGTWEKIVPNEEKSLVQRRHESKS